MAERGPGFWKIFLGVVVGIVVGGTCLVGGCVVLFGKACQQAVQQMDREQAAYLQQKMQVEVTAWGQTKGSPFVRVQGRVTNAGDKTVTLWNGTVRFLDASRQVVHTESTSSMGKLQPRESHVFTVMCSPDPRFRDVAVRLDTVWFEGHTPPTPSTKTP